MRRRAVGLLSVVLLLTGCGGPVGQEAAQVVFANLLTGGDALSMVRQGQVIENLGPGGWLANGAASPVLTINPGVARYRCQGAGGESHFETTLDLPAGTLSHCVVVGEPAGDDPTAPRLLTYRVSDDVPPGRYGLRFIHAVPQLGAVDIVFVEAPVAASRAELSQGAALSFGAVTGLSEGISEPNLANLASGEIVVRAAGSDTELLRRTVTLTVNTVATFALAGTSAALGLVRW